MKINQKTVYNSVQNVDCITSRLEFLKLAEEIISIKTKMNRSLRARKKEYEER